jgi:hypothetical protein
VCMTKGNVLTTGFKPTCLSPHHPAPNATSCAQGCLMRTEFLAILFWSFLGHSNLGAATKEPRTSLLASLAYLGPLGIWSALFNARSQREFSLQSLGGPDVGFSSTVAFDDATRRWLEQPPFSVCAHRHAATWSLLADPLSATCVTDKHVEIRCSV